MTAEAAREEARRRLGDLERYMRETRAIDASHAGERRRRELLTDALRETRLAIRSLAHSPLFALVAIVTLALGLGATAAIHTLLDAVVLKPLPYAASNELVYVASRVSGGGSAGQWGVSSAGYFHYRTNNRTLASLGVYRSIPANVSGDGEAERVTIALASADLFTTLAARPAIGRLFTAEEDRPGSARVAVLSHAFWIRRYGGADVIGRTIEIDASPAEIIGVLAEEFALPQSQPDLWMPMALNPAGPFYNEHSLAMVARLRAGESVESAQRDLARLTAQFTELYPEAYSQSFMNGYGFAVEVLPLRKQVLGASERTLWILFAAVGLVLLIACANVANLFLVRAEIRARDVAVRSALGAERSHLVWYHLAESLIVALTAAGFGLLLAAGAVGALQRIAPDGLPRLSGVELPLSSGLLVLVLAVLLALVFGLFPLTRIARNTGQALREGGRSASASRRQNFTRAVLVTAQIAMALTLLTSAGLLVRSFLRLRSVDPGFDPQGVLTASLSLPFSRYDGYERVTAFHRQLVDRLEALPGVERAAVGNALPVGRPGFCSLIFVEDRPLEPGQEPPCLMVAMVSPGYFEALGIPVTGRTPTWADFDAGTAAIVVTGPFAKRFWGDENPLDRGIGANRGPPWYRVAGVTGVVRAQGLDAEPTEAVFYPLAPIAGSSLWGAPRYVSLIVRTRSSQPLALLPDIRSVLAQLDADVPLANVQTMEDVLAASTARRSFAMMLLALAAGVAMLLSAVGIYGVISYIVGQRRSELGIRMALGARAGEVARMVIRQALRLAVLGVLAGLVASLIAGRALASLLFEVSPADPVTFVIVTTFILGIALIASWMPARRAARVSPVEVMRAE